MRENVEKWSLFPHAEVCLNGVLSFHDASLEPLFSKCLGVSECSSFVNLILVEEKLCEVFGCEAVALLDFLPKVSRRLVHADDVAEVDVLFSFSHDDLLSADVSQIKSFFCFHYSKRYLVFNYTGLFDSKIAIRSSSKSYWLSFMNEVHTRSPS